jgi:hypothetical protein
MTPHRGKRLVAGIVPQQKRTLANWSRLENLLTEARRDFDELRLEVATVSPSEAESLRVAVLSVIERVGRALDALQESCSGMQLSGQDVDDRSL